jgi:hypothetical protein
MVVSPEVDVLTHEGEKTIDCTTFCEFMKARQGLFLPLQQLQVTLINRICGKRFWNRIASRRILHEKQIDDELDDMIEKDLMLEKKDQKVVAPTATGVEGMNT